MRRALDEYEVGGIKTTLPFFREIVRDEEFKSASLDTGFISRFNERRDTAREGGEADEIERDMALIAAAIHYAKSQRAAAMEHNSSGAQNRWKMVHRLRRLQRFSRIEDSSPV